MSKKTQKATGVKVYSNGKTEFLTFEKAFVSLKEMQEAVNGYIEFVYLPDNVIMVVNEEGKINRLPVNSNVTKMYAPIINDVIVGDVLIIDSKYIN
jgi:hypothetical protein